MSYQSPTTHRFDVSNNRRVRRRIGAAAMGAGIVVFACVVLYSNAIAAPTEYAVDGLAVGDDLFGSAVQMAARICDIAQADAILVSREVRDACAGVDLRFEPAGSETLKGFSEQVQLFSPAH
jgi:hypothetical protein